MSISAPSILPPAGADTARPAADREARRYVAAVVGIVVAALALRLVRLGANSLWIDEINVVGYVRATHFLDAVRSRGGPLESPLHLVAVWAALRLPFDLETAARIPAALFGTLEVLALVLLARRLTGRRSVALTAGLLMAFAPFALRYSQEVRYYTAFSALHLVVWWLWVRAVQRQPDRRAWCWWGVGGGFLLLVHPYAPLVLGVQVVAVLVMARRHARRGPTAEAGVLRRNCWVGLVVAAVIAAPWYIWGASRWVPDLLDGRSYRLNTSVAQPVALSVDLYVRVSQWLGGNGGRWTVLSFTLAILAIASVTWGPVDQRRVARWVGAYVVVFLAALVPLARVLNTYLAVRRVEFLLPGLVLLAAMGIPAVLDRYARHRRDDGRPVDARLLGRIGVATVAALVGLSFVGDAVYATTEKTAYRDLAETIRRLPADDEVVIGPVDERWPRSIRDYLRWRGVDRPVHFILPGQRSSDLTVPSGRVVWFTGSPPFGRAFRTTALNSVHDMQVIAGDRTQPGSILPLFVSTSRPRTRKELRRQFEEIRGVAVLLPPPSSSFPWSVIAGR